MQLAGAGPGTRQTHAAAWWVQDGSNTTLVAVARALKFNTTPSSDDLAPLATAVAVRAAGRGGVHGLVAAAVA